MALLHRRGAIIFYLYHMKTEYRWQKFVAFLEGGGGGGGGVEGRV